MSRCPLVSEFSDKGQAISQYARRQDVFAADVCLSAHQYRQDVQKGKNSSMMMVSISRDGIGKTFSGLYRLAVVDAYCLVHLMTQLE